MEGLRKLKKIIFLSITILLLICQAFTSYSFWYEEPAIMDKLEDIDSMWWLSKKKKEKLKEEQRNLYEKEKIASGKTDNIKWLYDENDLTKSPKNTWEIIDDDNDGIGYKYYFDKNGYLLKDTITPDFKIVDKSGREVDINSKPITYDLKKQITSYEEGIVLDETDAYIKKSEPVKVIISEGVILREKQKIYDNSIDKSMVLYVDTSNKFTKDTKATIYNEVKWRSCQSLKGDKAYVVFNNINNNFNKVTGKIANEYITDTDDIVNFTLNIYDADKYDEFSQTHHLYDIEEIYTINDIGVSEPKVFTFTFDRSIKRLRFELVCDNEKTNKKVYLNDLKFGFSKNAYKEELERKKEEEEEIEELKRLGIYVEDFDSFVALDENGEEIEEDDEDEDEHINENLDDEIGGISYEDTDETESYEDKVRDKTTGPAFDEALQNEHTWRDSGPAFVNENNNIK